MFRSLLCCSQWGSVAAGAALGDTNTPDVHTIVTCLPNTKNSREVAAVRERVACACVICCNARACVAVWCGARVVLS